MISPKNVQSFKNVATRHRWQLSTMIKNVQKLIDKSKHESTSFNNSGYNFVNREGGIKEFRHLYYFSRSILFVIHVTLVTAILIWLGKEHPMTWDTYHSKEDMEEYLDYLVSKYPDRISIETIGYSFEGRIMRVAKVNFVKFNNFLFQI